MQKFVSIVTATYKSEKFIERLYRSLQNQTNKSFEWVIVDDCSPDGTVDILRTLDSPGLHGLRIYSLDENSGASPALSVAVAHSRGTYVVKIDHDDELLEHGIDEILSASLKWLKEGSDVSGVMLPSIQPDSGRRLSSLKHGQAFTISELRAREKVTVDALLVLRGDCARHYYMDEHRSAINLASVTLQKITQKSKFIYSNSSPVLYYHRDNPESITKHPVVSNKTVNSIAEIADMHDAYYYIRPISSIKRLVALADYALVCKLGPFYPFKRMSRASTRIAYTILLPLGFLKNVIMPSRRTRYYPEYPMETWMQKAQLIKEAR